MREPFGLRQHSNTDLWQACNRIGGRAGRLNLFAQNHHLSFIRPEALVA
jgi:hypothetical protein